MHSFKNSEEKHNTQFCLQLKPLFMRVSGDGPDFTDEPTGNLDRKNSEEIVELLKLSNKNLNQTILLITHDEKVALETERVVTLEDGRIISDRKRG